MEITSFRVEFECQSFPDTLMSPHEQYGGLLCLFCCFITSEDSYTVYPKSVLWTQIFHIKHFNYNIWPTHAFTGNS